MKYNPLGNSDLRVSELSFGCMSLAKDHASNKRILLNAFDAGINFFDTADLYDKGWNEESVGKALAPIRNQVVIASKVGNQWREDGSGWDWNPRKEYILECVEHSLRRLNIDCIDLYQLHGGTIDDNIDESIEAFELLKEQGKIREYGISSIRPNVIREYIKRSNIISVMMQHSYLDRRPEETCLDLLHEQNISVITRGSLATGILVDKPAKDYLGYSKEEVELLKKAIRQTGYPISSALQYLLNKPVIASTVVGLRTQTQLDEVLESMYHIISKSTLDELSKVLTPNIYSVHR